MKVIPKALIDSVIHGEVVLFLGAGASIGARHPAGSQIPSGRQLADMLIGKFLGSDYSGISLTRAAELSEDQTDLYKVQDFIASVFKEFQPAGFHSIIPTFVWKAIYTTNYDLIIERAYELAGAGGTAKDACLQVLAPILRDADRVDERLKNEDAVLYTKLHGCITLTNDKQHPLILTTEQYMTHRSHRGFLFERFVHHAAEHPVIYVGSSLEDSDIRSILTEVRRRADVYPRAYIILPNLRPAEKSFWEKQSLTCIGMTFKEFLEDLDAAVPRPIRKLAKVVETDVHPISRKFSASTPTFPETIKLLVTKYFDYVDRSLKETGLTPREFYRGYYDDFSPIIANYDMKRSISDSIISEVFLSDEAERGGREELFLLKGHAGSGKTVLLRRMAWDAATLFGKLCLWAKSDNVPEYEALFDLHRLCKERIYLFLDPANRYQDSIKLWLERARTDRMPLTIMTSERNHEWNMSCESLYPYVKEEYEVKYLRDKEIEDLLAKLKENKSLGYLEPLTREEQKEEFAKRAGRQLLVALYEATLGKPFERIILDEYASITSPRAKSLYMTTCILHRVGLPARAGLISRVHGIPFTEFKEKLFRPLEMVVFAQEDRFSRDYVYVSRHPIVAEIVFETVLSDEADRFNEYMRLINSVDLGFSSDRQAFIRITNARELMDLFKSSENIRRLYSAANDRVADDPFVAQQQAIFEMNSPDGSLEKAGVLLRTAEAKLPTNKLIKHSLSEWALRKSERAETLVEKDKYRRESAVLSRELTGRETVSPHPFHTLIKIGLQELQETTESGDPLAIERKVAAVERLIESAKQAFADDSVILAEESRFCEYVGNHPKALKALKQAFEANKGNSYVAIRLAKVYEEEGNPTGAVQVLSDCVDAKPSDKHANFNLALLLMKHQPNRKADIKILLRRAFTDGDANYWAQFWYARFLYLEDPNGEARKYFKSLGEARMSFEEKNTVRGIVEEDNRPVRFSGTVMRKEHSYGFIARDGLRDLIFTHMHDVKEATWDALHVGGRVTFELGFAFGGPRAVNIVEEAGVA